MTELELLHESTVSESEIDSLGHMNVRFYVSRAAEGNERLLNKLGMSANDTQALRRLDTYNRFHREQFAGAKLGVFGGLTTVEGSTGVTGYYEIRNLDDDALAASFVVTSNLVNRADGAILPNPELSTTYVSIPEHGKPRTLSLKAPRQVSLEEISALVPEFISETSINGLRRGLVLEEDCDDSGFLKEQVDPMFVMFRPQPGEELKQMGPTLQRDEQGRRYSFAMMEIRSVNWQRPKSGDTLVSYSADVNHGEKWRHTRRWIYAENTGQLLGISDHAAVCMDLDARKAIAIPESVRKEIEQYSLADYS